MKNKIYIIALALGMFLDVQGVAQGATINSSFDLNIECRGDCQHDNSLVLFRYQGKITETIHKTVNFVTASSTNAPTSFNLNMNDSVSLVSNPTTGDWVVTGGQYDTPPSDGAMYEVLRQKVSGDLNIFQIGTSIPMDKNNFVIESEDPSIVSCEDGVCKAVGEGTTHITVSFPDESQSDRLTQTVPASCLQKLPKIFSVFKIKDETCVKSYVINGPEDGYGTITFKALQQVGTKITPSVPIVMTYSLPSITYTVTVPNTSNVSQVTTCAGVNNITTSGATVNWTYADQDNDPQTNYAIDIATDPSFNDIVDTETAPNNTDVSAVRSLVITGLDPNTTYYARIQTYNDTNGWGDYASCGASFTTKDGPVDGICGETLNTCDDGTLYSTGVNQWICKGINNGADSPACTYQTSNSSCTPSDSTAIVGDEITYTVDSESAKSYRWMDNLGNILSGSTNSDTYSITYDQPGVYSKKVEITKDDGTKEITYCGAVRVDGDCGPQPDDQADACSIDGSMRPYECVNNKWVLGPATPCEPTMELVDDNASSTGPRVNGGFRFNPSLVPVGGSCKLFVNVKNARVCKLVNQSGQNISLVNTGTLPFFKVNGVNRAVGTYKLYCKATTTASHAFTQLGPTRSCYSSPNVKEN